MVNESMEMSYFIFGRLLVMERKPIFIIILTLVFFSLKKRGKALVSITGRDPAKSSSSMIKP